MASQSIKQQILEHLYKLGYREDYASKGRKHKRLVHETLEPVYVGRAGGFRRGHTLAESRSITDVLRRELKLPAYGESAACETCKCTSIHEHRVNRGCVRCGCKRYTGMPGWTPSYPAE